MKTQNEILAYINKSYQKDSKQVNDKARAMCYSLLEKSNGNYDEARILAESGVMLAKLTYGFLTEIQTRIEREGVTA